MVNEKKRLIYLYQIWSQSKSVYIISTKLVWFHDC
jgi:hypothetical protein